jgi:hypothetical protein
MKEVVMSEACSTQWKETVYIILVGEPEGKRTLQGPGGDAMIIEIYRVIQKEVYTFKNLF